MVGTSKPKKVKGSNPIELIFFSQVNFPRSLRWGGVGLCFKWALGKQPSGKSAFFDTRLPRCPGDILAMAF